MNPEARNRLEQLKIEKIELGSYNKLALKYDVNVRYIWDLLVNEHVPHSRKVCKKLGIIKKGLSYTRTRRQKLDRIARSRGYACWSAYESAMIRENE